MNLKNRELSRFRGVVAFPNTSSIMLESIIPSVMDVATVLEAELHKNRRICAAVFVFPAPVIPDINIACESLFCLIFSNASFAIINNRIEFLYRINENKDQGTLVFIVQK